MAISIVIADDHGILRGGLRSMLNAEPDMEVVGEAADGEEALRVTQNLKPKVLLADISMPGPSGIDVARELSERLPETLTIVLTMHEDPGLVAEAKEAGAKGYVTKREAESELIRAIRMVVAGKAYWPGGCPTDGPRQATDAGTTEIPGLQPEDLQLLSLIAHAATGGQIAAAMALTPESVDARRKRLMDKLGLRNRVDIFRFAQEHGII